VRRSEPLAVLPGGAPAPRADALLDLRQMLDGRDPAKADACEDWGDLPDSPPQAPPPRHTLLEELSNHCCYAASCADNLGAVAEAVAPFGGARDLERAWRARQGLQRARAAYERAAGAMRATARVEAGQ
jgi:hypothetical protein